MIPSPSLSHPLLSFSEDLNVLSEWPARDPLAGELASVHMSGLQLQGTNSGILG